MPEIIQAFGTALAVVNFSVEGDLSFTPLPQSGKFDPYFTPQKRVKRVCMKGHKREKMSHAQTDISHLSA
jgi:hypothetical protein